MSRCASARRRAPAWCVSRNRSAATTASARSPARAASPMRRSSRCRSTGWSTSRSSAARPRSRRRRSRRSRRSPGKSSCPSASGSSASRTSARSPSASTRTATASTTMCKPPHRRNWRTSLPAFNDGFLDLPQRPGKPRSEGLTHVIDKGLNMRDVEGMFDTAGQYVDIVKLGWGTSYVTNNLEKKIALYRYFETPIVCGGTLFEVVYARDRIDEFKSWLTEHRFSHVEISDGTIDIPRDRTLELIADFARDFTVLSEVGSKDPDVVYAPYQWVEWLKEEKDAGAWKVITEAREGGTAGIFDSSGGMRTDLIKEIADVVGPANIVFEAPTKAAQAWFIRQFGPSVNLGNIPPEEVIALETLRLGLRGDTLKEVLLGGDRTPAA